MPELGEFCEVFPWCIGHSDGGLCEPPMFEASLEPTVENCFAASVLADDRLAPMSESSLRKTSALIESAVFSEKQLSGVL